MTNAPESKAAVRVLIVHDHPVVRAGLASLLRRQIGVKLVGAAHSGEEPMEILKRSSVDVMLLDLRMPSINAIDLLNLLKTHEHRPKAILSQVTSTKKRSIRQSKQVHEAIFPRMRRVKRSLLRLRQWSPGVPFSLNASSSGLKSGNLDRA